MSTPVSSGVRVALVTGGNRGIGLEITRQLCKAFDGTVLLGARDLAKGKEAVKTLEADGLRPVALRIDVASTESIRLAKKEVEERYGRLDVLVNNAAVLLSKSSGSLSDRAKTTISINYYGTLNVTETFWPLLQPNSRVVLLSSQMGALRKLTGKSQRDAIKSPALTVQQLNELMDQFVLDAGSPDYDAKGWIAREQYAESYSVSKIGVSRLAGLQAKVALTDPRPGILVNACCPGWVRTDMGGDSATRSVEEGADTPVYLALLPPGVTEPNGQLVYSRKVVSFM